MPVNQTKCRPHNWEVFTPAQYAPGNGKDYPAKFNCKKCGLKLHASDAIQLDMLRYEMGFKKWLSVIAIIIAVASLVISIIAILEK